MQEKEIDCSVHVPVVKLLVLSCCETVGAELKLALVSLSQPVCAGDLFPIVHLMKFSKAKCKVHGLGLSQV